MPCCCIWYSRGGRWASAAACWPGAGCRGTNQESCISELSACKAPPWHWQWHGFSLPCSNWNKHSIPDQQSCQTQVESGSKDCMQGRGLRTRQPCEASGAACWLCAAYSCRVHIGSLCPKSCPRANTKAQSSWSCATYTRQHACMQSRAESPVLNK